MITQELADYLLKTEKKIIESEIIFPIQGENIILNSVCINNNQEKLLIDINRKGTLKLTRSTYQGRYQTNIILLRIDIDTKPHRNPDNTIISPTHIHIYREGYGDKWAYPLENYECFLDINKNNLVEVFVKFCEFCNITEIPRIQEVI